MFVPCTVFANMAGQVIYIWYLVNHFTIFLYHHSLPLFPKKSIYGLQPICKFRFLSSEVLIQVEKISEYRWDKQGKKYMLDHKVML